MKRKIVVFTGVGHAELQEMELPQLGESSVLVANEVSPISVGTERACLLDLPNLGDTPAGQFPKYLGYSGVGRVLETGKEVRHLAPGDRVLTYWGSVHSNYNVVAQENVLKLEHGGLASAHAAFAAIASFSLNGLRKTRLEIGESAAVVGMGILGAFALALCRIAGASRLIATDLSPARRQLALDLGATYVFDPSQPDYTHLVQEAAGGGVQAVIEVTGQALALKQALAFTAPFGRIALLGCTRVSDTAIDFYQEVHRPGRELIGAHAMARPGHESRPHSWIWQDDVRALWRFMVDGRLDMSRIVTALYAPEEATAVYHAVANDRQFPVGAAFDWRPAA